MKLSEEKILKKLKADRQDNLQKFILWSYKDLYEMQQEYWEAYKVTNSEIIYEKCSQVDEAIAIKKGNDEEIWDSLT
jgi:hypothetical protein